MSHVEIVPINSLSDTQLRILGDATAGESRLSQGYYSDPGGLTGGAQMGFWFPFISVPFASHQGPLTWIQRQDLEKRLNWRFP